MEAIYQIQRQNEIQRQTEIQREVRLQLLLQERLDQQSLLSSPASLHTSRLLQYAGSGLAQQYEQELMMQQQQEQIRRQQFQQQIQNNLGLGQPKINAELGGEAAKNIKDAERSLRRTSSSSLQRKRSFDGGQQTGPETPVSKRRASTVETPDEKPKPKTKKADSKLPAFASLKGDNKQLLPGGVTRKVPVPASDSAQEIQAREALQELANITPTVAPKDTKKKNPKGSIDALVKAAEEEDKADNAAATIAGLKSSVVWPESKDEPDDGKEEVIVISSFRSVLPQLPKEPEYNGPYNPPSAQSQNVQHAANGSRNYAEQATQQDQQSKTTLSMKVEYPYAVDTWWPSTSAIRKERRAKGEPLDEGESGDAPSLSNEDASFSGDLSAIRHRLASEIEPGVLEKVPHCRIHRMAMQQQRVASAPDHAFCWQVTENYCNSPMVCCSICSTWRHAACGGHYKAFTCREAVDNPFVPVCDRCHAERTVLRDFPQAETRLERQRVEQLRRALATSSVVRQAAFAKHGGTYKWPLGSVSGTHIGGHTRSVHSRHDKAEKQWAEMVSRLSGHNVRPKEKIKVRTRELERLLVSIEDAGKSDLVKKSTFVQHFLLTQ